MKPYSAGRAAWVLLVPASLALAALVLLPTQTAAQRARQSTPGMASLPARTQAARTRALHPDAGRPAAVHLQLPAVEAARLDAPRPGPIGLPLRIGVARPVSWSVPGTRLDWTEVADGWVARVSVTSPGAVALRVELEAERWHPAASVRFYAPDHLGEVWGPHVPGAPVEPSRGRQRAEPFWSPVTRGDVLMLEVWAPRSLDPTAIDLAVRRVAHMHVHPLDAGATGAAGPSGACNRNIACDPKFLDTAKSVALMTFVSNDEVGLCSGQLVAKTSGRPRPYFLTAAHCVADAKTARSTSFLWSFQRAACGGAEDPTDFEQTVGGARLVFTTSVKGGTLGPDTTLLLLRRPLPDSVSYSGWTIEPPLASANKARVEGIHHPSGDVKMGSVGTTRRIADVGFGGETHYEVVWNRGTTEGGSSGSGIWIGRRWPDQFLIGVLTGGFASCSAPKDPDYYGRFDVAFREHAKLRKRLDPKGLIDLTGPVR